MRQSSFLASGWLTLSPFISGTSAEEPSSLSVRCFTVLPPRSYRGVVDSLLQSLR